MTPVKLPGERAGHRVAPAGSDPPRYDIAIAGAGAVGLALACALADALDGARIAVVDPGALGEAQARDARASALSAGSKRLLAAIGAWTALAPHAEAVTAVDITDSSLEDAFRPVLVSYDNTVEGGEPATFIVENERLNAAILAAAARRPGIADLGGSAAGCSAGPHAVTLELADGRTLAAPLLVAADGRNSRLREAAGIGVVGWEYDQVGHRRHGGPRQAAPLPRGAELLSRRARSPSCRCRATAPASPGPRRRPGAGPLPRSTMPASWRKWRSASATAWAASHWRARAGSGRCEMHLARALTADRLALVGDAAHLVHPIAGQGLNLGLRDVAALTEVVADAARLGLDIGSGIVLERYARWRRTDAAMSAAAFDALNRLFSNDLTLLRTARSAGLRLVDRMPALKQLFVTEAAGLTGELPKLLRGERV